MRRYLEAVIYVFLILAFTSFVVTVFIATWTLPLDGTEPPDWMKRVFITDGILIFFSAALTVLREF